MLLSNTTKHIKIEFNFWAASKIKGTANLYIYSSSPVALIAEHGVNKAICSIPR